MAGIWYRAGTISVTNGSKKITGFGTLWKTTALKPDKGHPVHGPDGRIYELDYVESDTVMYIVTAYAGATAAGQAYAIDIPRTSGIPAFSRDLSAFMGYHQTQMDGWQQLLTGTGDVTLTAPDGTKLTVPTWDKVMNAGYGVVAQAKTEADRAKAEAANSAASAASAGNAVVAAALPLPDVWAPLSDSLRLITGYGREVKVGDDVVARMVNFSRSTTATYIGKDGVLKSAAANEPRFEKEGLLIDGQSTNLWSSQTAVESVNAPAGQTRLPDGTTGLSYKITANAGIQAFVRRNFSAELSGHHTLSCFAKLDDGSVEMPIFFCGAGGSLSTILSGTYLGDGWWRMQAVLESPTGNIGFGYPIQSGNRIPVWVCNFQLEALPVASSYIPTSGAAASRGPDIATLPQSLNLGERQLGFSLAIEFDTVNPNGYRVLELSDISGVLATGSSIALRHGSRAAEGISAPLGQRNRLAYTVAADGSMTAAINGKLVSLQAAIPGSSSGKASITLGNIWNGANTRPLFGHLRNLQIWTKKPLTADQLKVASA